MDGRVHPYALIWEVEPADSLEATDGLRGYSIPAIMARDQDYQP